MWNLNDEALYCRVACIELPFAVTWGSKNDPANRESIRLAALSHLATISNGISQWAFRIHVRKGGVRPFDLDNVPKLIVDSFCGSQIERDRSQFPAAALYPHDTIDHVIGVQIAGERVVGHDAMTIEVFGRRREEAVLV